MDEDKKYILGCDVGNGYAYVSLLLDPVSDPVPLFPAQYRLTDEGMPTTAYIEPPNGDNIKVFNDGRTAESKYKRNPELLIDAVKTKFRDETVKVGNIEKPVEVTRIYSAIVRDLLNLAEEELANKAIKPIYDVVFTFPAEFSDDAMLLEKMQHSIESLKIGEEPVRVLGRIPEPAAVAIDYLHYAKYIAPVNVRITKNQFTVLVYDLGFGTFDTAVVTAHNSGNGIPYTLHLKDGLPDIGGKIFDQILYEDILNKLKAEYEFVPNDVQKEDLRQKAVKAKIELSESDSVTVSVMNNVGDYLEVNISRKRFEELSRQPLQKTLELVQNVLDKANEKGIKIDAIVLSGGASRMPMVKDNLEKLVKGSCPVFLYRPSAAVSFGASRFAYGIQRDKKETEIQNSVMEQKTDCCYGIWVPSQKELEGEVKILIQSGESRPATSKALPFYSDSSRVVVRLYRSKENVNLKLVPLDRCISLLNIPFNVQSGSNYELSITLLENYGVQVELHSENGDKYIKTTCDNWDKLLK